MTRKGFYMIESILALDSTKAKTWTRELLGHLIMGEKKKKKRVYREKKKHVSFLTRTRFG
jgi:hypothetical protein